jgi:hypothetical protein
VYSYNIEPSVADLGGMLLGPTLPTFACYSIKILHFPAHKTRDFSLEILEKKIMNVF